MPFFRKNHKEKTDEELMSLLAKSEHAAFDELYARYSKPMLNFFFRMLNFDRSRAEDLLHDLFLKMIEKPFLFDNSKKFSTWIYTVAANMVKNEYRSRQVRTDYNNSTQHFFQNETFEIGETIDKELFDKKLNEELSKVDPELQSMFHLRFSEGMTTREIAEIMECPEGTVKSRIFYLVKKLSATLAGYK